MSKVVKVSKEDRLEASHTVTNPDVGQAIMRGDCDSGPLVQAFARHRLAAYEQVFEWLQKNGPQAPAINEDMTDVALMPEFRRELQALKKRFLAND